MVCKEPRQSVAGFPQRPSRADPKSGYVAFVVDKVVLGQVSFQYFGFLSHHSTKCSIVIVIRGWCNKPMSG
jgi:hypothetical protein